MLSKRERERKRGRKVGRWLQGPRPLSEVKWRWDRLATKSRRAAPPKAMCR